MLMAGRILRDPFLARAVLGGAIAQHHGDDTPFLRGKIA
jgi:hypothetical protein